MRFAADEPLAWHVRVSWAFRSLPTRVLHLLAILARCLFLEARLAARICAAFAVLSLACSQSVAAAAWIAAALALVWTGRQLDRVGWLDDPTAHCLRQLRAGRCPACAYRLAGLQPQPDDRTVCPECNGAWVVPVADTARPAQQTGPAIARGARVIITH